MNKVKITPAKQQIDKLKSDIYALTALQQSKDKLQWAYKNSQLRFKTIFEKSAYGNKLINSNLEIIKVNNALVKLLGYSKRELLGSRIIDLAHPDFLAHWEKLQINLWTANKPSFSVDTCLIKKDKTILWCHVTSILLEDNGETLGYTILENISERKALEFSLKEANKRQLLLQQQLLEATIDSQEHERFQIAEDVHNNLAQLIFSAKIRLDQVDSVKPAKQLENKLAIEYAKDVLYDCIKECRRLSYNLMPSLLTQFGLQVAIEEMCKEVGETIDFTAHFSGLKKRLPKYLEVTIFRIAQELTTNIGKHANATKASIKLVVNKKNIMITVEDDGIGFCMLNIQEGCIGIRTIENKLHLLKGKMDIVSTPGTGTLVIVQLPASL